MIIYKTTNLINGMGYVGYDTKNNPKYLGSGVYLNNAIKKHGKENFVKETIVRCDTKGELDFLEKLYIQFFNTKYPNGYNLTDGGDGLINPCDEVKEKHKLAVKEAMNKIETKEKIREFREGKTFEELYGEEKGKVIKEKISKYHSKKTESEKHRRNISKSMKGKNVGENNAMKRLEIRVKSSDSHKGKPSGAEGKHWKWKERR